MTRHLHPLVAALTAAVALIAAGCGLGFAYHPGYVYYDSVQRPYTYEAYGGGYRTVYVQPGQVQYRGGVAVVAGADYGPPRGAVYVQSPRPSGVYVQPPRGGVYVEPPRGGVYVEPPRGGVYVQPPQGGVYVGPPRGGDHRDGDHGDGDHGGPGHGDGDRGGPGHGDGDHGGPGHGDGEGHGH